MVRKSMPESIYMLALGEMSKIFLTSHKIFNQALLSKRMCPLISVVSDFGHYLACF